MSLSSDARRLTALIDKHEQCKHILGRSFRGECNAFIVAGDYSEWPEAVADKLVYEFDRENFPEPVSLRLSLAEFGLRERVESLLFNSLAGVLHLAADSEPNAADITSGLRNVPLLRVFYVIIDDLSQVENGFLEAMAETWEKLPLNDGPSRYLLLIVRAHCSRWSLLWPGSRLWHRLNRRLIKASRRHYLAPKLKKPQQSDVRQWVSDMKRDQQIVNRQLQRELEEKAETLFKNGAKLPHRELSKHLEKVWHSFSLY